jgi:hypothetical protein
LKGLETAFEFERDSGNMGRDVRPICIMSVSVTHKGLHGIAKRYLEETLSQTGGIHNMDLYVFTEEDTQRIIDGVLCPAIQHYGASEDAPEMLEVFGVDGEYGRHYNFLKSIAAFWAIFIKPEIKATFKIDLDQIFPQKELKRETGFTAFEHFITPLWGSQGIDYRDRPLDLGLLAGALVNEKDIRHSLFTPDIHFPDRPLTSQEYIFFSQLPQALSTETEMMTRYTGSYLDGKQKVIQRVHVTGGTNGILINSLRHHRPFTPSFIGRAEDQAYILSVLLNEGKRLAYVHKDGLIMRHDKEIFAQEAMESSYVGKLLGDYIRILYFSAYTKVLCDSISKVKVEVDPFTGCFISRIPKTVVYLRFGLQTGSFFMQGDIDRGIEFIKTGTRRIGEAISFVDEKRGILKQRYERERKGWNLFYDMLSAVERGLKEGEIFAMDLQKRACNIIKQCLISNNSHNDMR